MAAHNYSTWHLRNGLVPTESGLTLNGIKSNHQVRLYHVEYVYTVHRSRRCEKSGKITKRSSAAVATKSEITILATCSCSKVRSRESWALDCLPDSSLPRLTVDHLCQLVRSASSWCCCISGCRASFFFPHRPCSASIRPGSFDKCHLRNFKLRKSLLSFR